jgi:hypothetical protein
VDPIEIPESFAGLTDENLTALRGQLRAAGAELVAAETPSAENIAQAQSYADGMASIDAELASRRAASDQAASLRTAFSAEDEGADESDAEEGAEGEGEGEAEAEAEEGAAEGAEPPAEPESVQAAAVVKPVVKRTVRVPRPKVPEAPTSLLSITAAADVPGFSTGSNLAGIPELATALINRSKGFAKPTGNGETEDLRHFGVAQIRRPFTDDLVIEDRTPDHLSVLNHAADEKRLAGNSLVAAGGWCAPSEVLYDLCESETTDGMLSLPEVQVNRGGIKYTQGPDFSSIYDNVGFSQTEAQAISGTAKTCYEIPCPDWTEVRLDAVGLCIKVPILTNSAYPELVQRWLRGATVAHQHKVNKRVIGALATALGTPKVMTDLTSTAGSTLAAIELLADIQRSKYRWSMNQALEVVLPHWVKGAIRNDLSLRTGKEVAAVTDAMIAAEFAARNVSVQYVYDFQDLDPDDIIYPTTFTVLIYKAGTFVKGTSDVITLNAVYDAASLATNTYTGLFFEEGILTVQLCPGGVAATIAVCNSGHTGSADVAVCNSGAGGVIVS